MRIPTRRMISIYIALLVGIFITEFSLTEFSHASGLQNPQRQSLDSVVSRGSRTSRAILVNSISIDSDTISIDSSGTDMIFSDGANNSVTLTQLSAAGAGSAPDNATYITQTANGTLDSEQALTSLTSGLLSNDSATGIVSSRTITGTTDEATVTSSSTAIVIGISDPLIVGKGGTGVATITDGGLVIGKGTSAVENTGVLATGTIIVGDGATNPATLAVGSNGQVLSVDSSQAIGIKWAEPTPLTTKGDLFTYAGAPSRIAVGSNGSLLSADSATATGLTYATRNSILPVTAKGSIMTYSTQPIEFLVGVDGRVLSTDSSTATGLTWAVPTATGAPTSATYITQTANGTLSAEQNLDALSSGIMRVATTTGVITSLTDSSGIAANISDETGSGLLVFDTKPILIDYVDIGTTGVRINHDSDGLISFTGLGNGSDESFGLNLDDTANTVVVSTDTGVTAFDWGTIGADYDSSTVTLSTVSGIIDAGSATSLEVPNGADPTTDVFGELAADNDAWAASRGALEHFDGTASTFVVASLASDVPTDGQVPKWNTGGTITWEADTGGAGSPGGSNLQIQYNDAGAFGGATAISTDALGRRLSIGGGTSATVSLDVAGNFRTVPFTLTDAATIATDSSRSNTFFVTLGGNRTLGKPTNATYGQKIVFIISQDATGSRKLGFADGIDFGTTISSFDSSTTAGTKDYIGMIYNGVSWDVVATARGYP